jgi:peptide-methionine (S)-S-oxide reductase
MSHDTTTAFPAPVVDRGADLWKTCHDAMPSPTDSALCAKATFSGGCYWCLQPLFDTLEGVIATVVGYTGGRKTHPSHEEVIAGRTGHALAVQVLYDPRRLSYRRLLDVFWHNIDPTVPNRQFCAKGAQYRAAIFYHNKTQRHLAEASKQALIASQWFADRIVTRIAPLGAFYQAAACHQRFSRRYPQCYRLCRATCGRDQRLRELWDAPRHACGRR